MTMNKGETIKYIREYDPFFLDANLEHYTFHELMLIKTSIDIEKEKNRSKYLIDQGVEGSLLSGSA